MKTARWLVLCVVVAMGAPAWAQGGLDAQALKLYGGTVKKITIANTEHLLVSACKNHDCADNNTVLLYSTARGIVYGKIVQQRRATLIGEPSGTLAAELDRLWLAEWRQK